MTPSSKLMSIQSTVLRFVQVLSRMINLDVEVVDDNLVRIAGTGPYSSNLGRPLVTGTNAFKYILNSRKHKIIEHSGKDPECLMCSRRVSCQEKAFLGMPVMFQGDCIGVVSLVCFNESQREKLLNNISLYMEYIENAAQLFIAKTMEKMYHENVRSAEGVIRTLGDHVLEGMLELDNKGHCYHMNSAAREQLGLDVRSKVGQVSVRPFGKTGSGNNNQEEFIVMIGGKENVLPGFMMVTGKGKTLILKVPVTYGSSPKDRKNATEMIGCSKPMQRLTRQMNKITNSPSSVLIRGESGSGKEVVARLIHESGNRRLAPFVAINCAAIPEQLLESELFGYARGAFTGASAQGREGLVKKADGGTLFLDEIGDMPLHLQSKLLRVLDRREVVPVGSSSVIKVNVRVISATHQDFSKLLSERLFREDLFYRLNVIPLELPPLRKRMGDIPLLVDYFLTKHSFTLGIKRPEVNADVMKLLNQWSWPGNVRELANMMEYLMNMVEPDKPITIDLLPDHLCGEPVIDKALESRTAFEHSASLNLEEMERHLIGCALEQSGSDDSKQQVADKLGIGIATLYRKIKKYELEAELF